MNDAKGELIGIKIYLLINLLPVSLPPNSTAGSKRPNKTEENFGPIMRIRSQSANEASINHRRATFIGAKSNVSGKSIEII